MIDICTGGQHTSTYNSTDRKHRKQADLQENMMSLVLVMIALRHKIKTPRNSHHLKSEDKVLAGCMESLEPSTKVDWVGRDYVRKVYRTKE